MATIDATVGGANANSYVTLDEAEAYWQTRIFPDMWDDSEDQEAALIMATRVMDAMAVPHRKLVKMGDEWYYMTDPQWTGAVATSTQALAWPRTGMVDALGRVILDTVLPQALKNAIAELAGQLSKADRTLDNDVITQGIKSIKAGSVALEFNAYIGTYVIPDAVWNLMPDSWFTDEIVTPALRGFAFEVL